MDFVLGLVGSIMAERRKYSKKSGLYITAVQLNLETDGFSYQKWGSEQRCKRGDWVVNNGGDTYTIAADAFAKTYKLISPGVYEKDAVVWAEVAELSGKVLTKEGETAYEAGDYLVANNEDGSDAYAISKETFEEMYEPVD